MKLSKEYDPSTRSAILVIGDPGTRKTSLAMQMPRPYIFDADNNLAGPVRHYGDKLKFAYDNGHVVSEAWKMAEHQIKYEENEVLKPQHRYLWMSKCLNEAARSEEIDTIVVDGLTSVSDFIQSEIKRQTGVADDATLRIQDWGKFIYMMKHLVTQLKTTKKIIMFTGHNLMDKNESDGVYKTFLAVPGQSKNILGGLFNDVWATYIKVGGTAAKRTYEYRIRTMPKDNDHRGIKDSMGLPKTFEWGAEPILKVLKR